METKHDNLSYAKLQRYKGEGCTVCIKKSRYMESCFVFLWFQVNI